MAATPNLLRDKLSALVDLTDSYDPNAWDVYEDIRNNHKEVRNGGDSLAALSLAMALSSQPGDEYGFVKSANRDKTTALVRSLLMNLVPFLIEAHIDSALNDVALPQLRTLAKNAIFKQLYREILTTEDSAVQFSIAEDSSELFSCGNYRSNLLFVYEFFRRGNTPCLVGYVPNTDSAGDSFAGVVKAWLEQMKAPSEKTTFSNVFNKVLAAQTSTRVEGDVKDWSKFTQDLMQILLPVDLVYLPNLDMASGLPLIVENVLASVAPQAMKHDWVLTRADTNEWGVVSGEIVRTPVRGGQITLCAINDDPAFFTPNHPFVDKFGRVRAVDATAAHQENTWHEVGALKVGYVLLHTDDGRTYTEIPIQSLRLETVNCEFVHGVHLREGLRSYHANGYLVQMNYPEITIKTMANALRQIPPADQLRMLRHLEELQPLLARFGQGTVMGLLHAELGRSDSELLAMRTKPLSGPKVPALYFQSRSFRSTANAADKERLGDYGSLPNVDCIDGQIWLDGTACVCAQVLERGFVWSRPLEDDVWEHGLCSFGGDHNMAAGDGFIWVDDNPAPTQPSSKAVHFQALAVALHVPTEEMGAGGEQAFSSAGAEAAAEESYELEEEKSSNEDETPVAETGLARNQSSKRTTSCEVDTLQDGPTGEFPFKVLQVEKVLKQAGEGVPKFDFALPALDRLAAKLNETSSPGIKIINMYSMFVTRTEKKELCCEITMISPERLALAADYNVLEGSDDHGVKSYTDLKFTNMRLSEGDLDMRFILQKIVLTTNTLKGLIGGTWIEFDLKTAKTQSVRDLTTGFTINTFELKKDTQELLQKVMHYHMDADDRKLILGVKERPTPTASLTYGIDEIPDDLAGLLDPKLQEWIKGTYAPAWIAQCAVGLTDEQESRFKVRVDVPWQRRLKYSWQGSGKRCLGKSREYNELNTQLSILVFRRKYPCISDYLSDKTMATEETNNDAIKAMSGGKKWAHLLFEALMQEDMVAHIAKESALSEITQLNTLEMYCTMLNALWKDDKGTEDLGPLTLQLSNAVKACLLRENLFKHRAINDPKQLENSLRDYLLDFFTLILDEYAANRAGMSTEFREAMVESLVEFNQWKEGY
ncbi:uncharacterized protein LY79DRAFT_584964 [Colletotrichum navitas]|uniref:Uncharacterized protein n=1 Tax=Colletotrichum navitas TaxID=681940 RepID=A0AAD8PKQ7_9PEZI|nr:uncharacterized protein LY79DRAFT_584964 [Colletotrichum navitas]KAK1566174.1 hypothetical protein LY79DRAFT_584964 [Colletotrichum navitas]